MNSILIFLLPAFLSVLGLSSSSSSSTALSLASGSVTNCSSAGAWSWRERLLDMVGESTGWGMWWWVALVVERGRGGLGGEWAAEGVFWDGRPWKRR